MASLTVNLNPNIFKLYNHNSQSSIFNRNSCYFFNFAEQLYLLTMNIHAVKVRSEGKYKILLKYSDKTSGIVDLAHLAGKGVFKEWGTTDLFDKVHIDSETNAVKWNDTIELDSFSLYLKVKGLSMEEWLSKNKVHQSV